MLCCQSFFQYSDYQILRPWMAFQRFFSFLLPMHLFVLFCFEVAGIDHPSRKIDWPFHISCSLLAGLHFTDNEISIRFHVSFTTSLVCTGLKVCKCLSTLGDEPLEKVMRGGGSGFWEFLASPIAFVMVHLKVPMK